MICVPLTVWSRVRRISEIAQRDFNYDTSIKCVCVGVLTQYYISRYIILRACCGRLDPPPPPPGLATSCSLQTPSWSTWWRRTLPPRSRAGRALSRPPTRGRRRAPTATRRCKPQARHRSLGPGLRGRLAQAMTTGVSRACLRTPAPRRGRRRRGRTSPCMRGRMARVRARMAEGCSRSAWRAETPRCRRIICSSTVGQ